MEFHPCVLSQESCDSRGRSPGCTFAEPDHFRALRWSSEGKGAGICLRGEGGSGRPLDQPEPETRQEQEVALSGAVDSISGLVLDLAPHCK